MDRELKKLKNQFEENIPTSFTEKNKQDVLSKIRNENKKRNVSIYHLFPKSLTVLVTVALVFIGIAIFNWQFNLIEFDGGNTGERADQVDENADKENNDEQNPFENNLKQGDLSDHIFIQYIHQMSHQKVKAEAKWGFLKITNERIDWLLEGLDNTKYDLDHGEIYRDILERWGEGDFSKTDKDHNAVWDLEDREDSEDTEATGILNPDEERKYIWEVLASDPMFQMESGKITDPEQHELIKELVKKGELDPSRVVTNSSVVSPEPELTVGGFAEPVFYTSNFKLYLAHNGSQILVSDPTTHENDYDVNQVLSSTHEYLKEIEYEGDRSDELEKVILDIDKAIETGVEFGDPLLEKIHEKIEELENYFNVD